MVWGSPLLSLVGVSRGCFASLSLWSVLCSLVGGWLRGVGPRAGCAVLAAGGLVVRGAAVAGVAAPVGVSCSPRRLLRGALLARRPAVRRVAAAASVVRLFARPLPPRRPGRFAVAVLVACLARLALPSVPLRGSVPSGARSRRRAPLRSLSCRACSVLLRLWGGSRVRARLRPRLAVGFRVRRFFAAC